MLRLFPGLLTNDVADISKLPEAAAKRSSNKKRDVYVRLLKIRQKELASAFRDHMTKDQTYEAPNLYRSAFYTEVTTGAEEVNFLYFPVYVRMTVFSSLCDSANKSIKMTMNQSLKIAGTFRKAKACERQAKISVAS